MAKSRSGLTLLGCLFLLGLLISAFFVHRSPKIEVLSAKIQSQPAALGDSTQHGSHELPVSQRVAAVIPSRTKSVIDFHSALRSIKSKYLLAKSSRRHFSTKFEWEVVFGMRELRLLCQCNPSQTEPLLAQLATNPALDIVERTFAIEGLGFLAKQGIKCHGSLANRPARVTSFRPLKCPYSPRLG